MHRHASAAGGNPKCRCGLGSANLKAADCKCPLGYPQNAMMLVRRGGPSSDGIVPVKDQALRRAVVAMSQQLGLTSENLTAEETLQHRRIMGYGLPREDCTLRDAASPEEIAALADASGLCTIHFAPSQLDRQDLDDTGDSDLHPHIEITPRGAK